MSGGSSDVTLDTAQLQARVQDLQAALEAIRAGGVDAVVTGPPGKEQVYTLTSADRPYRVIFREMSEGAVTVSPRGVVLLANPQFENMLGRESGSLVGSPIVGVVVDSDRAALADLLTVSAGDRVHAELRLRARDRDVPALVSARRIDIDGTPVVCLIVSDSTAQKLVEATLRANEQELTRRAAEIERINAALAEKVDERTAELTDALRELEAQAQARMRSALEVNDTIVQVLIAAETEADLGHPDVSRRLLSEATAAARARAGDLLRAGGSLAPGSLVRSQPSHQSDLHDDVVSR